MVSGGMDAPASLYPVGPHFSLRLATDLTCSSFLVSSTLGLHLVLFCLTIDLQLVSISSYFGSNGFGLHVGQHLFPSWCPFLIRLVFMWSLFNLHSVSMWPRSIQHLVSVIKTMPHREPRELDCLTI